MQIGFSDTYEIAMNIESACNNAAKKGINQMDEHIFDKVQEVDMQKTMKDYYIDYAMSVIASRALPDVRDGLKPVQRRILYSMVELNNGPDKPHRKCARIVGDTMGKYHPHGDLSIYEALVKLAQDFNTRYPLVDGHGNFGSVDGDGAAAMRYTEARLSKISTEMTADLNKNTVDFIPNFDETEKEPTVLPSRYPNLLVNGTSGIAVGMATNIPPHNLREVIGAVVKIIDNRINEDRDTTLEEILEIVKGPDFPTGGTIIGKTAIEEAYRTGRAKIRVRAVTNIEPMANGKNRIVVTELPYMVNKARLIEKIAELVRDKRIDGITDLRDESDREGMRIAIELRRDVNPNIILNQLYKHTQLQDTFGVIMLALVDNQPKVLNLYEMLKYYLMHQEDVVTRRTKFELNKAQARAHILEGLRIALDYIDEVISLIRSSANTQIAKSGLMDKFKLSEIQAQAILDMRLQKLTGLEREKVEAEYNELMKKIEYLESILADEQLLLGVIKDEILEIKKKYSDARRTEIRHAEGEIDIKDLIDDEEITITLTHFGYIKRLPLDTYKSQRRGGRGISALTVREEDFVKHLITTRTHNRLLFFTNRGRVFRLDAFEVPEGKRQAKGTAIVNLLQLGPNEKIATLIEVDGRADDDSYLLLATKKGIVKKTKRSEFKNINKSGLIAIGLRDDDELIDVKTTNGEKDVLLVTSNGMSIRFDEKDIRPMGRTAMGVKGITLSEGDKVVSMSLSDEGEDLLVVSQNGYGKRTDINEYRSQIRAGKGIKTYNMSEKTGEIVGATMVNNEDELMLINSDGVLIRLRVDDISVFGRITSGVKLMKTDDEVNVVSIAKIDTEEE